MSFNLRIDEITDEKIKKIAEIEQRSKNKEIEFILKEYIKKYETLNGKLEINIY